MMSAGLFEEPPAEREEAHRRQRALVGLAGELVGRDLLDEELVVRQVFVERADRPSRGTCTRTVLPLLLEDVALGVGVAGDVEPVPAPPLAVVRGGEQAVDHLLERVGRARPLGERVDLLRRRAAGR
jgi:hypothetical protein